MATTTTRAEQLATEIQRLSDEIVAEIEQTSPERWTSRCADEGWSVGVVAHHVANHLEGGDAFAQAIATGQPVPPLTPEMLDQRNAEHAAQHANCTKEETLDLLRRNAATAIATIRAMSDEQLDTTAPLAFFDGAPVSAGQLAQLVLVDSPRQHLDSIRATR